MPLVALGSLEQLAAINVLSDPGSVGGPVVVPQAAQIVLSWSLESGKVAHNVLYGRYTGAFAGTAAQAEAIRAALTTGGAWTALAAFFSTTNFLSGVTIRNVNIANQAIIASTGPSTPGTSASAAQPNEVAVDRKSVV